VQDSGLGGEMCWKACKKNRDTAGAGHSPQQADPTGTGGEHQPILAGRVSRAG
jgi:hypothetical protein